MAPIILSCSIMHAQVQQQNKTLVVNGHSGEAAIAQINGRSFVDLETLARISNGSLGFRGSQIILTVPGTNSTSADSAPPPDPAPTKASGLSQKFVMAGIETISQLREWGSTLAYAIQNNYGVTATWTNGYREQAAASLRVASASAATDQDHQALQLLNNEFESVRQWSDMLVQAKATMDTAKYTSSPDALRNDPLSQKIITCGHFLGGMLGSGQFSDDASCH
jgi:hypothetical protein